MKKPEFPPNEVVFEGMAPSKFRIMRNNLGMYYVQVKKWFFFWGVYDDDYLSVFTFSAMGNSKITYKYFNTQEEAERAFEKSMKLKEHRETKPKCVKYL